jgi:O-antigen ligase
MLTAAFVVAGLLGAASMAVDLAATRGIFALPLDRLALDRFLLPACLFAYACAQALRANRSRLDRYAWALLASALIGLILLSGSRVGLLLLAAPAAMLLAAGGLRGVGRGLVFAVVGVVFVGLLFEIGKDLGLATDLVKDRLASTEAALRSPQSDYSLADRFAQVRVSWRAFADSPFWGVGPGHMFAWDTGYGVFRQAFTIDASTSTLAKFGAVGAAGIVAFFLLLARLIRATALPVERAAFLGVAVVAIAYLALSNPFEDKGFGFGLLFLLALALRRAGPLADR